MPSLPEQTELARQRSRLAALEEQLAERELEHATLQNQLRSFQRRYLASVGRLYAQLDEYEAQIAAILARLAPAASEQAQQAVRAREKAIESAKEAEGADAGAHLCHPDEELKALYRETAKQIHPDLATEKGDQERRTRLMSQVNEAYAAGDAARLRRILSEWHVSPEAIEGDGIASELIRTIRMVHQVEQRLAELETQLDQTRKSELFRFWTDVTSAEERGEDPLGDLRRSVLRDINAAKARLETMSSGALA